MSIAIAHFAIGATLATLGLLYFVPAVPYVRVLALLSGVWAMVPDVVNLGLPGGHRVAGLADSVWANAFWFHERIDAIDTGDSLLFAAVMVGALVVVTFLAERWDYRVREHVAEPEDVGPGRSLAVLRRLFGVGCLGAAGLLFVGAVVVDALTVLYIGTGAALALAGVAALAIDPSQGGWWRLPDWVATPVQLVVTFGTLVIASGLVTSLRTLDPLDAVYVGTALLLVTLLAIVASAWV